MKLLLFLVAALPFRLFATSFVTIQSGPAYRAIIQPENDCNLEDKTIAAIRIERAILDDNDKEIGRGVVASCSKTKSNEEYWIYTLDEQGKCIGKWNSTVRLDDRGRFIEVTNRSWDDDGEVSVMRYQNTYDSEGRCVEERAIHDEGETQRWRYVYDDGGDKIGETEFSQDGKVRSVTKFRYDDQHHIMAKNSQDGGASFYRYDVQGRLEEETSKSGERQDTAVYTYDEQGRPLLKRSFVGPGREVVWVNGFSYWPSGLIKDEWMLRPPTASPSYDAPGLTLERYAYDEHDHLTQEWTYSQTRAELPNEFLVTVDGRLERFGTSNGLRSFSYIYDSRGNWIKAVETQLSNPNEPASQREVAAITYRTIVYR